MSVTTSARRRTSGNSPRGRRQAVARRRRRVVLGVLVFTIVVIGIVALMPVARKAVNELGLPLKYTDVIRQQAAEKHLDPALVAAVIYAETKFDPRTSSAGAVGPMQLMPETGQEVARLSGATDYTTSDLTTPRINIAYGSYLLRLLLEHYHGNKVEALAAYNGGEANVDRWVADARARGQRFRISDIPFPETQAYVGRVLGAQHQYRRTYASQLGYG